MSGGVGNAIATSGIPFANTLAIAGSSLTNSIGTWAYTGGQSDISVAFGFGSYNFSTGRFGYLGKKGNGVLENIGYGFGALTNLADILAGFKPGSVELRTENDPNYSKGIDADGNPIPRKDIIGHSQLVDKNNKSLVDFGPTQTPDGFFDWVPGTNFYENGMPISTSKMTWGPITIRGVNASRIAGWTPTGKYNIMFNSCVSQTSRALNLSGAFNIGIHPYLLHAQMYLRAVGFRPALFSYYTNQN